jgi:hypothetical protein
MNASGVEAIAEILDPEHALGIDQRGQEGVVDQIVRGLHGEDAVGPGHRLDRLGLAGQKVPAGEIGAVAQRVVLEHLGRVELGVDGDRDERHLPSEGVAERVLHAHQLGGQERAVVGAGRIDEAHDQRPAAEIPER